MGWNLLRQMPALYIKVEWKTRTLRRQSLVPAHRVYVEVAFFDTTYQGVSKYMLLMIR